MDTPLTPVAEQDEQFFLRHASVRLGRLVEQTICYAVFAALLYLRLLGPGSSSFWSWYEPSPFWLLIFLPLLYIDYRNACHAKYLKRYRQYFVQYDFIRYLIIVAGEFSLKSLLSLFLAFRWLRGTMPVSSIYVPYAMCYIAGFIVGHLVPLQRIDRSEGCHSMAEAASELTRFMVFLTVSSVIDRLNEASPMTWASAFWPAWAFEGFLMLVLMASIPVLFISIGGEPGKLIMLLWLVPSLIGLGLTTLISVTSTCTLLDGGLCPPGLIDELEFPAKYPDCRNMLNFALLPWLIFLPAWAIATHLLKPRLAESLHEAWYFPAGSDGQADNGVGFFSSTAPSLALPPPAPLLMFRITPTFYARSYNAVTEGSELAIQYHSSATPGGSIAMSPSATFGSSVRHGGSIRVDPSTSILSARGAPFEEVVDCEQLCYVCYDEFPNGILLECGHAGLCVNCAKGLATRRNGQSHCPVCRSVITSILKIRQDLPVPSHLFQSPHPIGSRSTREDLVAYATARVDPFATTALTSSRAGNADVGTSGGGGGGVYASWAGDGVGGSVGSPANNQNGGRWPHSAKRFATAVEEVVDLRPRAGAARLRIRHLLRG